MTICLDISELNISYLIKFEFRRYQGKLKIQFFHNILLGIRTIGEESGQNQQILDFSSLNIVKS